MNNANILDKAEYYMRECDNMQQFCKCYSRQLGAVLVIDELVIPGYNGPPRGIPHCQDRKVSYENVPYSQQKSHLSCPRHRIEAKSGERLDLCIAIHAEVNTLLNAARMGVRTTGTILFSNNSMPCKNCIGAIVNAGVKTVVFDKNIEPYPDFLLAKWIADNSEIELIGFDRKLRNQKDE